MKKIYLLLIAAIVMLAAGCSDFLDVPATAALSQDEVENADNIEALCISAYAELANDHYDHPWNLYVYTDLRCDDAYKGGRDSGDGQDQHFLAMSEGMVVTNWMYNAIWTRFYEAISRMNRALVQINAVDEADFPLKEVREGEMRFLRAYTYFKLKMLFKYVPWITEDMSTDEIKQTSNREFSNDELWKKIYDEFEYAYSVLPETQPEVGRANKIAAAAFAAKTALYRAYEENEDYELTNINQAVLEQVIDWTDIVLASSYDLETDFGMNFISSNQNGKESIFATQFSHDDGTMYGRGSQSDKLNWPQGITGGMDFHKPSQNLVNAFKTVDGLPMLDNFNDVAYDYKTQNAKVDPRLYHTVAIPEVAYKYDETQIYQESWNRAPGLYWIYSSLKGCVSPNDPTFISIPPFCTTSKNRIEMRYADILLMRAEALVELGRWQLAMAPVNELRSRAAASTTLFTASFPTNTEIREYKTTEWVSQNFARKAVKFERRLELAMEQSRFFDLVRWKECEEVLNPYFEKEQVYSPYYKDAKFDKGEEYLPIPNTQISRSLGVYKQNNKWD